MLGITSERFPNGGAFLLAIMGGTGNLAVAFVLPVMGGWYDAEGAAAAFPRQVSPPPRRATRAASLRRVPPVVHGFPNSPRLQAAECRIGVTRHPQRLNRGGGTRTHVRPADVAAALHLKCSQKTVRFPGKRIRKSRKIFQQNRQRLHSA